MAKSSPTDQILHTTFPLTMRTPDFVKEVISIFETHKDRIASKVTRNRNERLDSDGVLRIISSDLKDVGYNVEESKTKDKVIEMPVFFGEGGHPTVKYQVDAYNPLKQCVLEVEAGRAWQGNAVYRDLILALIMVDVSHLILAVPRSYKFGSTRSGKDVDVDAYKKTSELVRAIYGHTRMKMPYSMTLIGY